VGNKPLRGYLEEVIVSVSSAASITGFCSGKGTAEMKKSKRRLQALHIIINEHMVESRVISL
jgi:hypothetical protein